MGTLAEYRKRPHHSYSSINSFVNICSLQWAFRYVYKLETQLTPVSLIFGNVFHRLCEYVYWNAMDGTSVESENAGSVFQDLWSRQVKEEEKDILYTKGADENTLSEQGKRMAECLVNNLDLENTKVLEINRAFSVPLVDADGHSLEKPLIGEIDCVLEREGRVRLVDWKTAGVKWPVKKAEKDLQPHAFCYAYNSLTSINPFFDFHVITKAKTPSFSEYTTIRSEDDFLRFVKLVKLVEKMAAAEHFLPSEQGFFCGGCQHRDACKSWHRDRAKLVSVAA